MIRRTAALLAILLVTLGSQQAAANSGGRFGSDATPRNCNDCRTDDGPAPSVFFVSPPTSLSLSGSTTLTLRITGGAANTCGFNAAASGGNLDPTVGAVAKSGGQLSQTSPGAFSGGACNYSFKWTAPNSIGTQTISAWGLSADGSEKTGDLASFATINITVNPICGDGNPQGSEQSDDGNAVTEECDYGEMSCVVCSSTCQNVDGATSFCGDDGEDAGNDDPSGRKLPALFRLSTTRVRKEHSSLLNELARLGDSVRQICNMVAAQQEYATATSPTELTRVCECIDGALEVFNTSRPWAAGELVRDYQCDPKVGVDRHRLTQVLVHLINNGRDAANDVLDRNSKLTVRTGQAANGCVRISVSDNGIGIPAEVMKSLFSHGAAAEDPGKGFGLHSAANSISELGGTMGADSAGEDLGAEFWIELPVQAEAS